MPRRESIIKYVPDADDIKDGITFDKQGRMSYHPDFHPNHKKPFTLDELIYICKFYEYDGPRILSFALGRTEQTLWTRIYKMRKCGEYERFKKMTLDNWSKVTQWEERHERQG